MANEPVMLDYLVVTWTIDSRSEAVYPHFYAKTYGGEPVTIRGYRGYVKDKLFFGRSDDRFILQATGSRADEIMRQYDFRAFNGWSFARLDVQLTVIVPHADHIILHTRPPKMYKSTLVYQLNEPGATLYVGSPTSRARLRVYNKTAETGIKPESGGDYLRIELQLRDNYADRAAVYFYSEQLSQFFRSYIAKMSDAFITDIVNRMLDEESPNPPSIEEPDSDWIARRYAWLEHSVMPAILRLALADPAGVARYLKVLIDKLDIDLL